MIWLVIKLLISKNPVKELSNNNNDEKEEDVEMNYSQKKDIYGQKKDRKLLMN